jgi:2,5-diketo-D-gluconate reductase A
VKIPVIKLADGQEIPQIGLGLWQIKDQAQFNTAFETSVTAGYRHFDTAQIYENE